MILGVVVLGLPSQVASPARAVEPPKIDDPATIDQVDPEHERPRPATRVEPIAGLTGRDAILRQIEPGRISDPSVGLRSDHLTPDRPTQPTERIEDRSAYGRTTANPDGTFTLEVAPERIHYRDAQSAWAPIDLSLVPDGVGPYSHRTAANDRLVRIGSADGTAAAAELSAGDLALRLRLPGRDGAIVADGAATFAGDGHDASWVRPTTDGFEFGATITGPDGPNVQRFILELPDGVEARLTAQDVGEAVILEQTGGEPGEATTVGRISAPVVYEAAADGPGAQPSSPGEAAANPSPTPTSRPSPTPTSQPNPTPEASASPGASPSPVAGPSPASSPGPTGASSPGPSGEPSATAEPDPSAAPEPDPSAAPEPSPSPAPEPSPTPSAGPLEPRPDGTTAAVELELIEPGSGDADAALLRPGEVLLRYTIAPSWLADPARRFPVVLDPTACIRVGETTGCDINDNGGDYLDHYIASGIPTTAPVPSTWIRVGYANYANPTYATMRGLIFFDNIALPDGAVIAGASMAMKMDRNQDSVANSIFARMVSTGWGTTSTWNSMQANVVAGYDSPAVAVCGTGDTNCTVSLDVEKAVRAWYTRRGPDWRPNIGFQVRQATEGSGFLEAMFYRGTNGTLDNRPKLIITYQVNGAEFDFDAAMGPTYAPSTMVKGQPARLPISVKNDGSSEAFTTATHDVGYRFFDPKGNLVSSGLAELPGTINPGASATLTLNVTPPAAVGIYTLRLDIVREDGTVDLWASDWAKPTLYYARKKDLLTSDNTRWTGDSIVERAEFGITVTDGGGDAFGTAEAVATGDGGSLGINLASASLRYAGESGVGFADLVPVRLAYAYDSAHAGPTDSTCTTGVIKACGWTTTYDERFVPGVAVDDVLYVAPSGDRFYVDSDAAGQWASGAPVRIDRPVVTFIDENGSVDSNDPDGLIDVPALVPGFGAYSGTLALRTPSATSTFVPGMPLVRLNRHREVRFAVRTDGAASAGVSFKIRNRTTGFEFWFIYTVGTNWTTGFDQLALGGTIANTWATYSRNLYNDVYQLHGGIYDEYEVIAFQTTARPGMTGFTYLDAVRLDVEQSVKISDAWPTWTGGAGASQSSDAAVGSNSIRVTPQPWANSPDCQSDACFAPTGWNLTAYPFLRWSWKAVGASTVAVGVEVRNARTLAENWLVYYAGSTAPAGVPNCPGTGTPCVIQVSPTLPRDWQQIARNIADDARQVLGYFNDSPTGSVGSPPSQGPTPDPIRMTGFRLMTEGGGAALFDDLANQTSPIVGEQAGVAGADDFMVTYPDRERHFFDRDGMLERILDRDGNALDLVWSYDVTKAGGPAHALSRIVAPSDGAALTGGTAQREIAVSTSTPVGFRQVTLTEQLGSTASYTGRRADFFVATASGSTYGVGDLVKVSPGRDDGTCGTRPNGCLEFDYVDASNHRLDEVRDPRWDGSTSGPSDYRFAVLWSGATPFAIQDRSHADAALVHVSTFDRGAGAFRTPIVQDAHARAAGVASDVALTPDGGVLTRYRPKACTGTCQFGATGSYPAAGGPDDRLEASTFDGLSRVATTTTWRCTEADGDDCAGIDGAQVLVSRRATNASAKVDNFIDPLAGTEVLWRQSPAQNLASLRDSGGANPDLYRTSFAYDAAHRVIETASPVANRVGVDPVRIVATTYDPEGHPTAVDDATWVRNPGFESGTGGGWAYWGGGVAADATTFMSGVQSLRLNHATADSAQAQEVFLLPGQTFRLQLAMKAAAGSAPLAMVYHQRASDGALVGVGAVSTTSTAWTPIGGEFTVPLDGSGLVYVIVWAAAGQTAWFDDVTMFTTRSRTSYNPNGLPGDRHVPDPDPAGATAELRTRASYVASSVHPAVFPTTVTANHVDGVYSPSAPDTDVTTSTSFDRWGRPLVVTDPDGVTATTTYAANGTDVASVADGLGNTTTYGYDLVGNRLTTTTPLGRLTALTYDLRNAATSETAPDGTRTARTLDDYGHATATYANHVDGNPSGSGGLDDVKASHTYDAFGRPTSTVADDGGFAGAIKAKTITNAADYDRLGKPVRTTDYADTAWTVARTTTSHFETYAVGGMTYVRATPSGTQLPIAPTAAPAPLCPGPAGGRCNSVDSVAIELAWATTDAYGVTTVVDRDLDGRIVRSVANHGDGLAGPNPDDDRITTTRYDVAGRPTSVTGPDGLTQSTTYDDLGRPTKVVATDGTMTRTTYRGSGRVDRESRPAADGTPDTSLSWTRTEYDAAGRPIRIVDDYDASGTAGLTIEGFESGLDGWTTANDGWFINNGAGSATFVENTVWPLSGYAMAEVWAAGQYQGIRTDLPGTYVAGRQYRLRARLLILAGSPAVGVLFGQSVPGQGTNWAGTSFSTTGTWLTVDLPWTPTTTASGNVRIAVRKEGSGGATSGYLIDDLSVEDTTAASQRNIPTESVYDADGRIVRTIVPPSSAGGAPMTSATAYDALDRPVVVTRAVGGGTDFRDEAMYGGPAPAGLWPLDEVTGTTAVDVYAGRHGTASGAITRGRAGGVDQAATAYGFDGSSGKVTIPFNKTAWGLTTPLSMSAWFKTSYQGAARRTIVRNSHSATGFWLAYAPAPNVLEAVVFTGSQGRVTVPAAAYTDGRWHHVASTYDGTILRLYLDGAEVANSPLSGALSTADDFVSIGGLDNGGEHWLGDIDEVVIHPATLSPTQVASQFAAGRKPQADRSLTSRTNYDALGRPTEATDPSGRLIASGHDRLGRLTATVANPVDGTPTDGASIDDDVTSTFAYDALGELIGYCPPVQVAVGGCDPSQTGEAQAWRYAYDALGRRISETPPVNTSQTALDSTLWTYEPGGRLGAACRAAAGTTSCTAAGAHRRTAYGYDDLGRETTRQAYSGASAATLRATTTTTYGADGTVTSVAFDGTAMWDETAGAALNEGTDTLTFTYDAQKRLDQVKRGAAVLADYGYDPAGRVASRTDGTTGTQSFGYDWADRPASVTSTTFTGSLTYAYGLDGLLRTRTLPGGAGAETLAYDAAKRPIRIDRTGGDWLARTYDRAGHVVSESRALAGLPWGDASGSSQTFAYDPLGRVTGSSGLTSSFGYEYDLDGNRTKATKTTGGTPVTRTFAYDRTDQLVSQRIDAGPIVGFASDVAGAVTTRVEPDGTTTGLRYDTWGRLVAIDRPASSADPAFAYDAAGRIRSRTVSGGTDTYAYAGLSETVHQVAGATTTDSILGPAGERLALKAAGTTHWTLLDAHGDLVGLLDSSGAVKRAIRYDPYGELTAEAVSGSPPATPWRYQAALDVNDGAAALYDIGARLYGPAIAAWTSLDPFIGPPSDPAGLNRYLYAEADPVTLRDPTGLWAVIGDGDVCPSCDPLGGRVASRPASGVSGQRTLARPNPPVPGRPRPVPAGSVVRRTPTTAATPTALTATVSRSAGRPLATTCPNGLITMTGCSNRSDTSSAHLALDAIGSVDPSGAIDAANAIWYLLEGRPDDAAISAIAASVPYLGDVAKGARLARHADELVEGIEAAGRPFAGGRYGDLRARPGIERNHIPPDSVTRLPTRQGPAIQMERADHYRTASWGNSVEAQRYRAVQLTLINAGRFDDAVLMDIIDIRSKFGTKYDEAILQMIDGL
jgi:RHS repeat-associated protein